MMAQFAYVYCATLLALFLVRIDGLSVDGDVARIRRQTKCRSDQHQCGSGECISVDSLCDGREDCTDGSDETVACKNFPCPPFAFKCEYGGCIDPEKRCDGTKDCKDGSDEPPDCGSDVQKSTCQSGQFRCADGTCIGDSGLCDGIEDCSDGSDETHEECKNIDCYPFSFRCAYGACVNSDFRCNGVKNCRDNSDEENCAQILPPTPPPTVVTEPPKPPPVTAPPTRGGCIVPQFPSHGRWSAYGSMQYSPGQEAPALAILNYTCNIGYKLRPANSLSFCSNGKWSETPACIEVCPTLESTDRLIVQCDLDGGKVSCENPYQGTRARVNCRPLFENPSVNKNPNRYCDDGSWDYPLPICEPVCGLKSVDPTKLLIGGKNVTRGDYPWQVGIYRTSDEDHICGGSIISPKVILTAAHCFEIVDKELYLLAAGKYFRKYKDDGDPDAQYSKIQELIVHEEYNGGVPYVAFDLAILVAQTAFQITQYVLPVCFDPNPAFDFTSLINKKGVVIGWGYTTDRGSPSDVLKELIVDYKTRKTCTLPTDFKKNYVPYAPDKLCAGVLGEGKSACQGDSGGGLVFLDDRQERYFIRGIVSVGPKKANGGCDETQLTLYTSVQFHADLIDRFLSRYKS